MTTTNGIEKVVQAIPSELRIIILFLISDQKYLTIFSAGLLQRICEDDFTTNFQDFTNEQMSCFHKYFGDNSADNR